MVTNKPARLCRPDDDGKQNWLIWEVSPTDGHYNQPAPNRRSDFLPERWERLHAIVDRVEIAVSEYSMACIKCAPDEITHLGTHKGHHCQEGVRIWPGDYARRRAGLTILLDPSSQLPGSCSPRGQGSSWSARSRVAARTNELDAGERRKIIEGEEGTGRGWIVRGRVLVPGAGGRSGLTSTHPAPPWRAGGCHDHVSGTGLLSHDDRARRWRRLMPQERAHPGLGDPPVFTAAAAACWHRRLASR